MPTCYRHSDRETYIRCQRCDRPICPDCMRDAAVGFHCPSCVAEGAKQTRQGRTAYGGTRPGNPSLTSFILIGLNIAVWLAVTATGGRNSRLVDLFALRPDGLCLFPGGDGVVSNEGRATCLAQSGTQWLPGVVDGAYWQLLTSAFMHVDLLHIGLNMLALYLFAPQLEMILGRWRFLALYLLSALTGSVMVYWASNQFGATLGASGAIFGLLGALLVVTIKVGGNVQQLVILLAINGFITFTIPNISWQGHLGGLVGGAAICALFVYAPKERRTPIHISGLVTLGLLLVLAVASRTLVLA